MVLWLSFVLGFALFLFQRWLLTIRLRQAYWNLTLRIRWPILCSGSTGIKPRSPTFDPWLTLGRPSPPQVECSPALTMVMQGLLAAALSYPPHSLYSTSCHLFFFKSVFLFLLFSTHMPQPFHNTRFNQLGRFAVLLEGFQQLL